MRLCEHLISVWLFSVASSDQSYLKIQMLISTNKQCITVTKAWRSFTGSPGYTLIIQFFCPESRPSELKTQGLEISSLCLNMPRVFWHKLMLISNHRCLQWPEEKVVSPKCDFLRFRRWKGMCCNHLGASDSCLVPFSMCVNIYCLSWASNLRGHCHEKTLSWKDTFQIAKEIKIPSYQT